LQLTGADIVVNAIHRQDDVEHVLVRHEQGATHAADGFARSTGKPGVVLVTSGPGITNAITGIATAYMDSIPMVVISGQVMKPLIGYDAFQEIDAVGISRPCVKHNFLIQDVNDITSVMKSLARFWLMYLKTSRHILLTLFILTKLKCARILSQRFLKPVK